MRDTGKKKNADQDTLELPLNEIKRRQNETRRRSAETGKQTKAETDPYKLTEYEKKGYYIPYSEQRKQAAQKKNVSYADDDYYEPSTAKSAVRRKNKIDPDRTLVPPGRRPVKKKNRFLSSLTSIVLVIAILAGCIFGCGILVCSKTNYEKSKLRFSSSDVMKSVSVYNVLFIGTDKESGGAARSDSMILVSVDNKENKIKLTSFLRDMFVTVPGVGDTKLNAAYAKGGAPLLIETIENTFKVKINNYATVDFETFKLLIDALGGVDVDITEAEANFINRTSHAKVHSGMNTLDGDYALIYSRIRKLDTDFKRTERQRKVILSILDKAKDNPLKILFSSGKILKNVTTDISPVKMTFKALGAPKYLGYKIEQLRIPVDGQWWDARVNGQAVLKISFPKNIKAVQEFIYGESDY